MSHPCLTAIAFSLCVLSTSLNAAEVVHWRPWRGPLANGSVEDGNDPTNFGAEQYRWRAELPGKGCSTPIVSRGMIYLTCAPDGHDAWTCFDLQGKEKWRTGFGKEYPGKHRNSSDSNTSPVTDGRAIFAYIKSGTFAAMELNGDVRWKTDLVERFGKDTLFWDHDASPVLTPDYGRNDRGILRLNGIRLSHLFFISSEQ